jgi:outer membrane autotransporter protein
MSLWSGASTLRILNEGLVESGDVTAWATWGNTAIEGDGTLRTGMLTVWSTIRPGNSIGTLTVDGDVTMEPNSVLETEIDNSGRSDTLSVTGDMSIVHGTVHAVPVAAITQLQQYTIVEANSVSGTFDTVVLPDAVAHTLLTMLSYEPDSVSLTVTPFDGMPCLTRNQRALGAALQSIANVGPTPVTSLLQQVPTLDGVRAAYDQLSGQSRPALAPVAATDSARFLGIVSNRLQGARGIVADSLEGLSDSPLRAMLLPDDRFGTTIVSDAGLNGVLSEQDAGRRSDDRDWGVWAKMYGLCGDRETEHGTPGYSYNVFGQSFGVDLQFSEQFLGGITGGYSDAQVDYARLADEASIGATHAGLYGSYSADGWYLNYVATHSWLNFNTRRVVDLTDERHKGSFDGHEWSGYLEAGFDWQPAATWLVQPLAGLQVAYLHLDAYAETGLASALVYKEQDYESYKTSLGARVTKELILGPHGRAAIIQARTRWVHEFGDVTSSVDARFEDVPGVWFTVSDEGVSRDSLLLGAGTGIRLTRGLRAFVDYDVSLNPDNTAQVISGAVEYRW